MSYFISQYLVYEEFETRIKNLNGSESVIKAIKGMRAAFFELELAEAAFSDAESVLMIDQDIFLQILFLEFRAKLAIALGRIGEGQLLIAQIKGLLQPDMPHEYQIIPITCEISLLIKEGNFKLAENLIEECLQVLSLESDRYLYLILDYGFLLAIECRMKKIKDTIESICLSAKNYALQSFSSIVLFVDSTYRCELDNSLRLETTIDYYTDFFQYFKKDLTRCFLFILVLKFNYGTMQEYEFLKKTENKNQPEIMALYYLIKRKPEEAQQLISVEEVEKIGYLKNHDMAVYKPISVALSCGGYQEAKLLLIEKIQLENSHYFDDFIFARIEYLEGNTEKALAHFKMVYDNCIMNDCLRRLEFEMDLACELKNRDNQIFWDFAKKSSAISSVETPESSNAPEDHYDMLGESPAIKNVYESIKKYGPLNLPVLIIGETGTGKELTARALHTESSRRNKPYLAINCGAISESLLHSELFGYEQGAFTGASKHKIGILEAAGDGTVFLDEIGEISPAIQVALLRVLENNEIRPVGGSRTKKLNFRFIAATNAPLQLLVEQNKFRMDLLYRLQRFQINLPPLRHRKSDIKALAINFLQKEKTSQNFTLSENFIKAIENYPWPGNIRELKNEMEKIAILNVNKNNFTEKDLPQGKFQSIISANYQYADNLSQLGQEKPLLEQPQNYNQASQSGELDNTKNSRSMEEDFQIFLGNRNSTLRRKTKLIKLFEKYQNLTRSEVARVMNLALNTAAKDLENLESEGVIERIKPSASPRTHYFSLVKK